MMNQSLRRKPEPQIKWNEMKWQQDGWPMLCRPSPKRALSASMRGWELPERMSCRTTSKQCKEPTQCTCKVFLAEIFYWCWLFSPRVSVLVLAFLMLSAMSSCCSVFTAEPFCALYVLHQHRTGLPMCPSTPGFPKALNSSSLPKEWDLLIQTLKVCALPHLPIPGQFFTDDIAMVPLHYPAITESVRRFCSVLIHKLPLITPLFSWI